jgi:hypothetical protein
MTGVAHRSLADQIDDLASRVNLLGQNRVDPEKFHAEKDDIAVALRRLARAERGPGERRQPTTSWKPEPGRNPLAGIRRGG